MKKESSGRHVLGLVPGCSSGDETGSDLVSLDFMVIFSFFYQVKNGSLPLESPSALCLATDCVSVQCLYCKFF